VLGRNLPNLLFISFFSFYLIKKRSFFFCQGFLVCYFVLYNRVITDQYYIWLFSLLYLAIAESTHYRERNYRKQIWIAYRTMFACLVPVAFWAFFKHHLEHATGQWNMLHFWMWNVFALFMQTWLITSLVTSAMMTK
jgi:hypothetical protein